MLLKSGWESNTQTISKTHSHETDGDFQLHLLRPATVLPHSINCFPKDTLTFLLLVFPEAECLATHGINGRPWTQVFPLSHTELEQINI